MSLASHSLPLELFVSAGEASSDAHCARLIRELRAKVQVASFGMGGKELLAAGTELLLDNRTLAGAGGPLEIISQLPKRREIERALKARLAGRRPHGAILVDTGEINLRLARILRSFNVPVVYFIPPKVWVWRSDRLRAIARDVALVLSVLPFEEPIYKARNIPFQYVGNPLLDEVPIQVTEQQAKTKLGLDPGKPVLTVLPGSRHNEIRLQLELFAYAVKEFLDRLPKTEIKPLILIPAAQAIEPALIEQKLAGIIPGVFKIVKDNSHLAIKCGRAALIKSGTSTLEAALLQVPMVLTYHSSRSAEWIFRHIVRYRGFVGLVNLFLEPNYRAALGLEGAPRPVVPEMILDRCSPELIAAELLKVYSDGPERARMLSEFARVPSLLLPPPRLGHSPIQAAANAALSVFRR